MHFYILLIYVTTCLTALHDYRIGKGKAMTNASKEWEKNGWSTIVGSSTKYKAYV